jgi:carboxylesterase type B
LDLRRAPEFGKAGQPDYDGLGFAKFDEAIVVTLNYR